MNIALICPTSGLERYATLSTTHLVLAQITDSRYTSFYQRRRDAGDILILDNGAHEQGGSIDFASLETALVIYQPNVCVLPDILSESRKTQSLSLRFLDRNYSRFPNTEWMFVPQGMQPNLSVLDILHDLRVGPMISWIGVTRYLTINHRYRRTDVAKDIRREGFKGKFHALGMVNGSIDEFREVRDSGLFTSLDTSVPIWRGWNGYSFHASWPEISVDFHAQLHEQTHREVIKQNLEDLNVDTNKLG